MHQIDCHILTMPQMNPDWVAELRRDLDAAPVNQHWLPGIADQLGAARAIGFSQGSAPFVSFADPDDRVMSGTFARLFQALQDNPGAPFAWAGEQRVDADLMPIGQPNTQPSGYSARRHRNNLAGYVQGVVLIRRSAVVPVLGLLRQCGLEADGVLFAHLARLQVDLPTEGQPVHVPIVGRLWRQHANSHHVTAPARARGQQLAGVVPQYLHVTRQTARTSGAYAPCASCGPPRKRG